MRHRFIELRAPTNFVFRVKLRAVANLILKNETARTGFVYVRRLNHLSRLYRP